MTTILWIIIAILSVAVIAETVYIVWLYRFMRSNQKQLHMYDLSTRWSGK